ncbi:DUF4212 domain-containing protein [Roseateles sp.]|uniref:DUF4212 domain-containing protein n=1 Tax=Roseateles sp. TaxID=1971397 RepID=UPI002DF75992|nr:DUF4212 domain-containing protein [Roseateles sp.]
MGQNAGVTTPSSRDDYWRRTRRLTAWLLLAWAVVAFAPVFFARELSIEIFGWPLGFWLASQGALLGFCAIVIVYAWRMRRLDEAASPPEVTPPGTR